LSVAAGVPPAVEPGILPGGGRGSSREVLGSFNAMSRRQDLPAGRQVPPATAGGRLPLRRPTTRRCAGPRTPTILLRASCGAEGHSVVVHPSGRFCGCKAPLAVVWNSSLILQGRPSIGWDLLHRNPRLLARRSLRPTKRVCWNGALFRSAMPGTTSASLKEPRL
jgi:hypothetical protein